MRSLVVLSLFFDQTTQNSQKNKGLSLSLMSLSLSFLFLSSLVNATNCTQTFFFILFFSNKKRYIKSLREQQAH